MILAFTGTRKDCTFEQQMALLSLLKEFMPTDFLHGCAIGADHTAMLMAKVAKIVKIIAYPCNIPSQTSKIAKTDSWFVYPEEAPLVRNRRMVNDTEMLLACPYEVGEQQRGGTWYTIRYARKQGKKVIVINPDGTLVYTP